MNDARNIFLSVRYLRGDGLVIYLISDFRRIHFLLWEEEEVQVVSELRMSPKPCYFRGIPFFRTLYIHVVSERKISTENWKS